VKRSLLIIPLIVYSAVLTRSQVSFPSYFSNSDFSLSSPGALKFGLYGFDNPAMLTYLRQPDFVFAWTHPSARLNDLSRWGFFAAFPNLSFGFIRTNTPLASVTDYRLATSWGNRTFCGGFAFGWSGGDRNAFNRSNLLSLGFLSRPDPHVSVGLFGTAATRDNTKEAVADLAIRPLGNELVAVFGDYAIQKDHSLADGAWSTGLVVEPLPGIRITGRYFETKAFAVGLELSLGRAGFSTQTNFDRDANRNFTTYTVRVGAYDRTVVRKASIKKNYVDLNLLGPMKYQRFLFLDDSKALREILAQIDAAELDETVGGIAINTSGMNINREMLWEIREKLKEFKSAGKRVVIFIDRPGMGEYHFASVADKVVMDPWGMVTVQGFLSGRTFVKGTLDKLGLGFTEWRYFKYKSANESLSREQMSAADREQRLKLVDDFYRVAKDDICEGRKLSPERFDRIVNEDVVLTATEALDRGLVDQLGRWDEVKNMIEKLEGEKRAFTDPGALERFHLPYDNRWGGRPRIAVIYAIGECAMDEGITARKLVKDVEAAGEDGTVRAIVLRVDSPGGDGMASDYIAEAMKKAKKNKPVIVSQGAVAASGGYWLSMYADTIVAAPTTVTGSIGVIGGWLYNTGFKQKIGLSTDYVKVGEHADLGFGATLPLIGASIPDRDLTVEEQQKAERITRGFYKDFVGKVAEGRRTDTTRIEPIAQGRVWSGLDGKVNGLVDVLGGLETAIAIARTKAGIAAGEDVEIVELPRPGFIDWSRFVPRIFGVRVQEDDPLVKHLLFRLKHNGEPLPLMPLDDMEFREP
jgi:protease-4